uniref:Uncharacterized protein LOC114347824 n=1 Tax=Diabrotica virgifera virgifera TaxID=50390 RepID=A0A6P7HEW6_DIAVI
MVLLVIILLILLPLVLYDYFTTAIAPPATLNIFNDIALTSSRNDLDRSSIPDKASTDSASIHPKAITDNTTRTPGCGVTSSKTNLERSETRQDNNETLASSGGDSSSSRMINQHFMKHTNTTALVPVRKNPEILTHVFNILYNFNIKLTNDVFQLESLREESWEYQRIKSIFFQSNKSFCKLHSIEKVHNPYLQLHYALKKDEYIRKGIRYMETMLFHGTRRAIIKDICRNNFNWRLTGT